MHAGAAHIRFREAASADRRHALDLGCKSQWLAWGKATGMETEGVPADSKTTVRKISQGFAQVCVRASAHLNEIGRAHV